MGESLQLNNQSQALTETFDVPESTLVEIENRVKSYMRNYDGSHDFAHVLRVKRNALRIFDLEREKYPKKPINQQLVVLASLLHDIGDYKYSHDFDAPKRDIKKLTEDLSIPEPLITDVLWIVDNLSFRKELQNSRIDSLDGKPITEFQIVQDADRLDAIGAIGLARMFTYNGSKGGPIIVTPERPLQEYKALTLPSYENYNKTSVNGNLDAFSHIFEKLIHLKDKMKTSSGKQIAAERHNFMHLFVENFAKECELAT